MEPYQQLEVEFGKWTGVENVVACSSGTAALHLALEALQLPQGSEVLIPDFAMIACPRAATLAGLTPVFVDCDNDLLMDVDRLYEYVEHGHRHAHGSPVPKWCPAKAIMPVHIYGRRCDMNRIAEFAARYKLRVIEDVAEAHGIAPHPDTDAACWSLFKNKIICSEEGGIVAFRNPEHATLTRQLRCLGFTETHDFNHIPRGHNYRLANSLANFALNSLANYENNLRARRQAELWYDEHCPAEWLMPIRDAPWVFDLRIPRLTSGWQNRLVRRLNEEGISARHAFKPMHTQPEYCDNCCVIGGANALRLSREVIYLPLTPGSVTEESVKKTFALIHQELRTWT